MGIGMTSQRTRDRLVARLRERGIQDERVLEVMGQVPRHLFLDEAMASRAYEDTALPIGYGQTISQPYVVAMMTAAVLTRGVKRVLEIGTGSGYQAAVLSRLLPQVYSVERVAYLCQQARQRFKALAYNNIEVLQGDGSVGWRVHAPYDAILVTAAPEHIPPALLKQLAEHGRIIVPLGTPRNDQKLTQIDLSGGQLRHTELASVRFVPLRGGLEND